MPERRDGQTTVTALLPPLLGLARRVRDLVQRGDPGAQRAALGLRALNAFALAGMAALFVEHGSRPPGGLLIPPGGGGGGGGGGVLVDRGRPPAGGPPA